MLNSSDATGAKTAVSITRPLPFQGGLADPYISEPLAAALSNCDVWIDVTFPNMAGSQAYEQAMKSKRVRYLLSGDLKADGLVRMFGKVDLDALYRVQNEFIRVTGKAVGKTCRITNEAGSDVSFTLDAMPYPKPRRCAKPGLHTPLGAMPLWPIYESVKGRVVVGCAFHEYYVVMPTPMSFEINGRIKKVTGGGSERTVMDRALRRAARGNYGYVIHFTCGLQPSARFTGNSFVEDQRVAGNNAVGLGTPFWQPGGGENHPDAVMFMQSIWIEGRPIVDCGTIVGPPKLAKLAEQLQPLYN